MNYKLFVPLFLLLFSTLSVTALSTYSTPLTTGTNVLTFGTITYPTGSYYKRITPELYTRGISPDCAKYASNGGVTGSFITTDCSTIVSNFGWSGPALPALISPVSLTTYNSAMGLHGTCASSITTTCPCAVAMSPFSANQCLAGWHDVSYELLPILTTPPSMTVYQGVSTAYATTVTRNSDSYGTTDISCARIYWDDGTSTSLTSLVPNGGTQTVYHTYASTGLKSNLIKVCGASTTGSCGTTYTTPVSGDGCAVTGNTVNVIVHTLPTITNMHPSTAQVNVATDFWTTVTEGTEDLQCVVWLWGDGTSTTSYYTISGVPDYETHTYMSTGTKQWYIKACDATAASSTCTSLAYLETGCSFLEQDIIVTTYTPTPSPSPSPSPTVTPSPGTPPTASSITPNTATQYVSTTFSGTGTAGTNPLACMSFWWYGTGAGTNPIVSEVLSPVSGSSYSFAHTYTTTGVTNAILKVCDTTRSIYYCVDNPYTESGCSVTTTPITIGVNPTVTPSPTPTPAPYPTAHTMEVLITGGFTTTIYSGDDRYYLEPFTVGLNPVRCIGVDWGDSTPIQTDSPLCANTPGYYCNGNMRAHTYTTAGTYTANLKVCDTTYPLYTTECQNMLASTGCDIEPTTFNVYTQTSPGYDGDPCLTSHDCHVGYRCNEQYVCENMQRWSSNMAQSLAETTFPFMELGFVVLIISFAVYVLKHNSEAE